MQYEAQPLDRSEDTASRPSDEQVIQLLRAGETGAFEFIMRRYNQRLFRIARSILNSDADAQDAMQEAYVRAYFNLARFTGPPHRLGAWLARITVNEALMRKRKDRRLRPLAPGDSEAERHWPSEDPQSPERAVANGQLRELIEQAVDALPEGFRSVFVLRAVEQLSVRETAQCLDIPEATVKTRFHRARSQVQEALRRELDAAQLSAFEFAGWRCDRMVARVLSRIGAPARPPGTDTPVH